MREILIGDLTINIKDKLSFVERSTCITEAVDMVFPNGFYACYLEEFAFRYAIVKFFTDYLDKKDFSGGDASNIFWDDFGNDEVWERVFKYHGDFWQMLEEFNSGVNHRKQIEAYTEATYSINEAATTINQLCDGLGGAAKSFDKLLKTAEKKLKKVDVNTGASEIVELARRVSNGGEREFAEAVLENQNRDEAIAKAVAEAKKSKSKKKK